MRVGVIAGFAAFVAVMAGAAAIAAPNHGQPPRAIGPARPWVEGVDPAVENELFYSTYGALQSHNVLKVYAFSAGGYESAAIRFSGRVPHEARDLSVEELAHEAVVLIRTTFDGFPAIQHLDVWATVPVAQSQATSVENTVFSVSADRSVYEQIDVHHDMTDMGFLASFGRVWIAPPVPR
jgi:hypothetical protein